MKQCSHSSSIFVVFLFFLLVPFLSAFTVTRLLPIRSRAVTIAVVSSSVQDGLTVFGELTKDIGNLGAVIPLALGIFLIGRQDNKYDRLNKETRESFLKDIKSTSDLLYKDIKSSSDLLSKDIKETREGMKEARESFLKDIKSASDLLSKDIKSSSDLLSKEIKSTSDAISRLEKIVEKNTQK